MYTLVMQGISGNVFVCSCKACPRNTNCRIPKPGNPKGETGRGETRKDGAGRGLARRGEARRGEAGWGLGRVLCPGHDLSYSNPRLEQKMPCTSTWNLCEPKQRAVDEHSLRGTTAALRSWLLLTDGPAPLCLCKSFSCNACLGIANGQ